MTRTRKLVRIALQRPTLAASLKTALVVGLCLNLVNQGDALWGDAAFSLRHGLLNFLIPFCVSSYSAARAQLRGQERPAAALRSGSD